MLLWEKHMCYSEMRNFYSGYVTLLLEDGAVFIFCIEASHWEKHMCYSEMRRHSLGYVYVLFELRAVFIFSVEALFER